MTFVKGLKDVGEYDFVGILACHVNCFALFTGVENGLVGVDELGRFGIGTSTVVVTVAVTMTVTVTFRVAGGKECFGRLNVIVLQCLYEFSSRGIGHRCHCLGQLFELFVGPGKQHFCVFFCFSNETKRARWKQNVRVQQ